MKIWISTPFIATVLLLVAACAHKPDRFSQIKPGMDQIAVHQLLGAPQDRSFSNGEENWTYRRHDFFSDTDRVKIITFREGNVISLKNDEVAEQRSFEIARARAGATRIKISRGNGGSSVFVGGQARCSKWNAFGRYPEGGGCNTFGCWPPGGECTAFGCSASSHCGAVTCPDRIPSLRCR